MLPLVDLPLNLKGDPQQRLNLLAQSESPDIVLIKNLNITNQMIYHCLYF